jgi:type IV secretory pathway TraG/TraD family ATPase VirD4
MDNSSLAKRPPEANSKSGERNWPEDDEALLELSADGKTCPPENYWCLKDAFEGVQIFGGTGSGKSSGSGQAIARAFLESNLGGLVLTAKNDEVLAWKEYAKAAGRASELLIVEPGGPYRFNFLRYELRRSGSGAGHTENLVNLFCSVLEAAERKQGQGGGDAYWQRTLKQLLRNSIDLAIMALDDVELPSLYRIITSAPRSAEEAGSAEWRSNSACFALIEVAEGRVKSNPKRAGDFELTRDFWLLEFPNLAPETRSVIVSTFTSMADCFMRGMLRELFCSDLNFSPEDSFSGRIIILNLPVKEFNELGQFAQVLFKFIWQRAVERRIPAGTDRKTAQATARPVFLWADESQFFVNSYDALFQSTARGARASTVYLTQNLPTYFSAFGGQNSRSDAESFLGNLQTKIFHANGDPTTNNWAADSIGKTRQATFYGGMSEAMARGGAMNQSAGGSMVIEFVVQPQEFTMLRTGGEESDFQVDSIIFQGGRRWVALKKGEPIAQNYIRPHFKQRY